MMIMIRMMKIVIIRRQFFHLLLNSEEWRVVWCLDWITRRREDTAWTMGVCLSFGTSGKHCLADSRWLPCSSSGMHVPFFFYLPGLRLSHVNEGATSLPLKQETIGMLNILLVNILGQVFKFNTFGRFFFYACLLLPPAKSFGIQPRAFLCRFCPF